MQVKKAHHLAIIHAAIAHSGCTAPYSKASFCAVMLMI